MERPTIIELARRGGSDAGEAGGQDEWDLRDRADRRRLYENLLAEGDQHMIMRWVDGALLVDVWAELVLPEKIQGAWAPAVAAASAGRSRDVFHYHA